jgi:hypothetical protein
MPAGREPHRACGIDEKEKCRPEQAMARCLHLTIAIGAVLIFSSPLRAQAPSNSSIGPTRDSSVTTGIGTRSSIKVEPPPPDQPPPQRPVFWDTPEAHAKPQEEDASKGANKEAGEPAAAPPPAQVVEDPRTMITRDRIESPQH